MVYNTEFVPTSELWPTQPDSQKIADELKLLEKLTNILPAVLDEEINRNDQNNVRATAKRDLEVFEQNSLSHYLDPEAEVVVFRKNERSQRQISDTPPQKLDAHNRTETHIFIPVTHNFNTDNHADREIYDPTILDTLDGTKRQISDTPLQNRPLNKDNGSKKLIPDSVKSDFNLLYNLSQCNSCIASLNQMKWNLPEPNKTVNNQHVDIAQWYPLQIPNTNFLKSQNPSESEKGNYLYLPPALENPHLLQGYRRINYANNHIDKLYNRPVKRQSKEFLPDQFEFKIFKPSRKYEEADKSTYLNTENNPYEPKLAHSMPNQLVTNIPDLSNMYPWLLGSSSLNTMQKSQSVPAIHSISVVKEPEMEIELNHATPAPTESKVYSPLAINNDKFEYYDTLINMISRKNAASGYSKHNVAIDSSVKDAANEKLVVKMNEFRQQLAKLKAEGHTNGQEMPEFETQLLSYKNIRSEPPIQYLKIGDNNVQSEKVTRATLPKLNPPANEINQQSKTKSAMSGRKTESNDEVTNDEFVFEFKIPPINIDITSNRRASDTQNEGNIQSKPTEPLDMLIKQLLYTNGFDKDKIENLYPQLVNLLSARVAYFPKYAPYPPHQIPEDDNINVENISIPNYPITDNIRNVYVKDLPTLNVISNVPGTDHIAKFKEYSQNNETTKTIDNNTDYNNNAEFNVTDSIRNPIQSLLASHNITNNSDPISVSTTIVLDVTNNDTNINPNEVRGHLEVIKSENKANNTSVLLLNKRNYDEILKSLNSFTLERNKAYVTVIPTEKNMEPFDVGRSNLHRTVDPKFLDKVFGNEYFLEKDVTVDPAKEKVIDSKDILDDPQVFSALKKQTELMGKLLLKLRGENSRRNAGKDFQELIKEVEAKKYGMRPPEVIEDINKRIGDETKTPGTTVLSLIDETEVRKALRNSPYVKRILKLSKQKRERYLKGKKARRVINIE